MKTDRQFLLVLVTAPGLKEARHLAQTALRKRLVACVNLVPGVESHYRWKGALETSREVLMILKTTKSRLRSLERLILAEHSYDTPEFVVIRIVRGNRKYLDWLLSCVS